MSCPLAVNAITESVPGRIPEDLPTDTDSGLLSTAALELGPVTLLVAKAARLPRPPVCVRSASQQAESEAQVWRPGPEHHHSLPCLLATCHCIVILS